MKHNLLFWLLLTIFSANVAFAQKVDWGKLNQSDGTRFYPTIIGEDENNIYTFGQSKGDLIIEAYDKENKLKKYSTVVDQPKIDKNKVELERIIFVDGKFVVFASYYKKQTKQSKIYAFVVDGKTGKMKGKKSEIFSVPVEKKRRRSDFYVFVSDDRSKILVNTFTYYKKQKEYKDVYKLLDSDFNVLVEREDKFSKKERESFVTPIYKIDNDGSLYFLKKKRSSVKIVSYDATRDYEKWEETIDVELGPSEKITDLNFTINSENDLIISGYYEKKNKLQGCMFLRIDNVSKEIVANKTSEFSKDFKKEFLSNRQKEKGKEKEIPNLFSSIKIQEKADGGIILAGEVYYYVQYRDRNGNTVGEYYLYGDIIVMNLSKDGDLLWVNRVPKKQVFRWSSVNGIIFSSNGLSLFYVSYKPLEYFSFFIGMNEENVYIVYNDNPKNFTKPKESGRSHAYKKWKKGTNTLYTINLETGKKDAKMFLDAKDMSIVMKPNVYYQKDQKSDGYVFGQKKKKYKFGTVKFQ